MYVPSYTSPLTCIMAGCLVTTFLHWPVLCSSLHSSVLTVMKLSCFFFLRVWKTLHSQYILLKLRFHRVIVCTCIWCSASRSPVLCTDGSARSGKEPPGELKELGRAESTHVLASLPVRFLMLEAWHPSVRSFKPGCYHPSLMKEIKHPGVLSCSTRTLGAGGLGTPWLESPRNEFHSRHGNSLYRSFAEGARHLQTHRSPSSASFPAPATLWLPWLPQSTAEKNHKAAAGEVGREQSLAGSTPRVKLEENQTTLLHSSKPKCWAVGFLLRAHTFLGTYIFQGVSRSSGDRTAFVQPSTLLRAHSIALQRKDNSPGKIPIFFSR